MPGAQCARGLACKIKQAYELVTTVTPERPGIPRAMVLRLTSRSPRLPRFLTPSPALLLTGLTPTIGASEPHDFAVRKQTAFVSRAAASTASRPAFVTIASRPSIGTGQRGYTTDLGRPASIISEIQKLIEAPGAGKKAYPGGPIDPPACRADQPIGTMTMRSIVPRTGSVVSLTRGALRQRCVRNAALGSTRKLAKPEHADMHCYRVLCITRIT